MLTRTEMNKRYRLYDNQTTLDRYTLVDMEDYRSNIGRQRFRLYACLSFSENLTAYCEHSECMLGRHLGKRLDPFDFPNIQNIISKIF